MSYCDPIPPAHPPCTRPFNLVAVIVCENYHDLLRHSLPMNKCLFDRVVVVTSYMDKATQRICEFYHVECIKTDATQSHKGLFCKGAAINVGLEHLQLKSPEMEGAWALHMDADIVLPPQTRILLKEASLDPTCIYGSDRFMVKGPRAWNDFQNLPALQQENEVWVHMGAFPLGVRVMNKANHGYVPIGFFQLWNPTGSNVYRYPEGHQSAAREDAQFAIQWPRAKRHLLPEIVGYHLESDDADKACNWGGRVSAPFVL